MRQAQYELNVLGPYRLGSASIERTPDRPDPLAQAWQAAVVEGHHHHTCTPMYAVELQTGVLSATIRIHPFDLRLGPAVVILCSYLGYRTLLNASINQPSAKHAHAQSDVQPASLELHQVYCVSSANISNLPE
ncbi:hypothetical protein PGTUg99_004102 [Puccinia graminis f. sp. tritici]|uniref:Uncharacterized protein n=1 Tax=Puccinia graminis f. sp. tritici TaxID=56615 RepID=A0A5B0NT94_PUCGR|nr:hypothetical protein PGTUg99_004102 [Puccinia graminis f. sp. tritici]